MHTIPARPEEYKKMIHLPPHGKHNMATRSKTKQQLTIISATEKERIETFSPLGYTTLAAQITYEQENTWKNNCKNNEEQLYQLFGHSKQYHISCYCLYV